MARKPPKGKSLAEVNPELAKEWHHTNNGDLTPFDVSSQSNKKVWWKCDKGEDHEWEASIYNVGRNKSSSCPFCAGRKVSKSNCLATTHPEIAKQWHPTLNAELTPFDVIAGTYKKVWWKCDKGEDHEWLASCVNRKKGASCPICTGRKVVNSNCLATTHPEIAKQWHPTKNGVLTANCISYGFGKKVWWKCDKGEDHEWEATPNTRSNLNSNCPICSNSKVVNSNCLATTHPLLSEKLHPTKNGNINARNISFGSDKKVWWKCDKGEDHEWEAIVYSVNENACPICNGKKVVNSNCLATTHPQIANKWHPTKNRDSKPTSVTRYSNKKVWWKCDKGEDHEWQSSVNLVNENACPICNGKKVVNSNCLATTHPEIAKQWHPTKNGNLTPKNIIYGTHKKIWWKCDKGKDHEWQARGDSRKHFNLGCPFCTLTPQSRQELTITFELLKIFKDINPKGFKTRVNGKLWTIDIYIPQFNLGIEFDGSYWHKDKQALDKLKTEQLSDQGFKVIRVREEPLKKLFETDVISNQPFNGKDVTDKVLKQIMSMFDLSTSKIRNIDSYLAKKELQNEKGLEDYIEMILTEKAKK